MYYLVTREQPFCVYCEMAKTLANKARLDYKVIPYEEMLDFMKENNLKTLPVIFKDEINMNNYIGGATDFQKHVYSL